MAKKDFSDININPVYDAIQEATAQETQQKRKPRKEPTPEEARELLQSMRTTGHKGLKLPRINLAFAPDCYEYVQTMSRVRGESMTDFINLVIREHKENHGDIYEKALEFRKLL